MRITQGHVRDAVDLYEEALEAALPERQRGTVVVALARAYRAVGDLTYASELVESFLAEAKGLPLDPGLATEMQTVLISIYFERGDVLRAERAASRALASAGEEAPPEIRANTYWAASRVLAEARRWDEALELATRARVIMEELDDHRRVAQLHNAYAFICLDRVARVRASALSPSCQSRNRRCAIASAFRYEGVVAGTARGVGVAPWEGDVSRGELGVDASSGRALCSARPRRLQGGER